MRQRRVDPETAMLWDALLGGCVGRCVCGARGEALGGQLALASVAAGRSRSGAEAQFEDGRSAMWRTMRRASSAISCSIPEGAMCIPQK